jgi:hypothetical protein
MEKFRITIDSEQPNSTKVYAPNGEDISQSIEEVRIVHRAGEFPLAYFVAPCTVDARIDAKEVTTS